ncbi:galactosyltransferase-related protein [Flavitalea sp. BT771]|uniref:galactosyltransferase-related protein n=1 Tax=Flavitalea sp. BT771 TaxID=3063329 RepID=UPI0026E2F883|nr:galactosyltransferase-related protein [Flavitalea sp. BT771]MDO6431641.1 galactosyltransferase-related protein [Flavitalea sp. BT771]MDV6220549.1 galactosyltransferase-related protein [Flavitalea sp. BT771]
MYVLDYKLAFIVPYRNREQHLRQFVPHYRRLFPDADIYIVHQLGEGPFNRGKLLNIGFLYAENKADAFDLSDIDMLAVDGHVDYSFPSCVTHMASAASQYNYTMPYPGYFSGHVLLTATHMRSVNGFYNDYPGYGCEDDCFYKSFLEKGLPVERRYGRYESLPHERVVDKDASLMEMFNRNWEKFQKRPRDCYNGLSSCEYEIRQVLDQGDYIQIDVAF